MPDIGNVLNSCQQIGGNTGTGSCFSDFGAPVGVIFVPKGATFTTASIAALQAQLLAGIINDNPVQRIYPVNNIIEIQDSSEKVVVQTSNLGAKKVVRDVYTDLTLTWWDGGFCLLYALRKANGLNRPFLIYTNTGLLIGTNAGAGLMKGIVPTLNWANAMGWSDGSKSAVYSINLNWSAIQTNDNVKFVDFSSTGGAAYLNGLTGLENINLTKTARTVGGLISVNPATSCGGIDLFPIYPTQFIASLWKAYADNGGAANLSKPIAITSVTPGTDAYGVQLNIADANYPILPAPGAPTLVTGTSGGVLAAATYYYKVTALNAYGETIGSTEANATTTGSTSSITLSWTAVPGATGYRVYRGTSSSGQTGYIQTPSAGLFDAGIALTTASVPVTNTTGGPVWIGLAGPVELLAAGIGGADGSSGFEAALVQM